VQVRWLGQAKASSVSCPARTIDGHAHFIDQFIRKTTLTVKDVAPASPVTYGTAGTAGSLPRVIANITSWVPELWLRRLLVMIS